MSQVGRFYMCFPDDGIQEDISLFLQPKMKQKCLGKPFYGYTTLSHLIFKMPCRGRVDL